MKNLCCSKKILLVSYLITVPITIVTILSVLLTEHDTSALVAVSGFAWAETTAANAFYYWKAKNENRIKLTEQMVAELAEKYGIDAVTNLVGIILKD